MNRKDRDQLLTVIQKEDELLRRVTNLARNAAVIAAIALVFTLWGFLNFKDPLLPNIAVSTRRIVGWIAVVIFVISLILAILALVSRSVGKKSIMAKIDKYQGKSK